MALTLPIYKRGNTFVLHIRIAGRQIKRSLATNDAALAKLRAMQLLGQITTDRLGQVADKQKFSAPPIKLEALRELSSGVPCESPISNELSPPVLIPIPAQAVARNAHVLPTFFTPKKALEDAALFKMARVFGEYIAVKKIKEVTKVDYASYPMLVADEWSQGLAACYELGCVQTLGLLLALLNCSANRHRGILESAFLEIAVSCGNQTADCQTEKRHGACGCKQASCCRAVLFLSRQRYTQTVRTPKNPCHAESLLRLVHLMAVSASGAKVVAPFGNRVNLE